MMKTLLPQLTLLSFLIAAACSNSEEEPSAPSETTRSSDGGASASAGGSSGTDPMDPPGGSDTGPPLVAEDDPTLALIEGALADIEPRLTNLTEGGTNPRNQYYCYTDTQGNWDYVDEQSWCSGFLPGTLWLAAQLAEGDAFTERATALTEDVSQVAVGPDNDTGFQIYGSSGLALLFAENDELAADWEQNVLTGAASLYTQRYNPTIGAFRSWAQEQDDPYEVSTQVGQNGNRRFEVNIDMLMNMELILRAAELLEERGNEALADDYRAAAESHFDNTWRDLVRADGSTYHVVQYGPSGEVLNKRTHQGYEDESTWSRGQGWVIYAHSMFNRYLPMDKWIERGAIVSDYYLEQTVNQVIPPSDFDQPSGAAPRDSSAAAIVCSAFVEMSTHAQWEGAEKYLEHAQGILSELTNPELLNGGPATQESLLWGCTEAYGEPEVGCAFGDYYFLECMQRYVDLSE